MARTKLPNRRSSTTRKVAVELDGGKILHVIVTIGFDDATGKPLEVFCADFKAGTSMHAIVMDACVCFSRLLQHGDTPQDLVKSMAEHPRSLLGAIALAVAEVT